MPSTDNVIDFQTYRNNRVRVPVGAPVDGLSLVPALPAIWPAYWLAYWMFVPAAIAAVNEQKNG